jgi:hypothetical protein
MTRIMGDAIHDNVPALVQAGTQMVAGYVTGSLDVLWTPADWALFPGVPAVTIDQGYTGSPAASANVRDVEQGAWTVAGAVNLTGWTAPRPTIYCSASVLPQLGAAAWQGDVWVADWTGTPPASPPVVPVGMTCVAVQYTDQGGGGLYDLSVVFDPYWPAKENMDMPLIIWGQVDCYLLDGGRLHTIQSTTDLNIYLAAGVPMAGSATGDRVTTPENDALVADFPPGQPVVTVPPVTVTFPTLTTAGTITPNTQVTSDERAGQS